MGHAANQNCIHTGVESRLNPGNGFSVQLRIHRVPLLLYELETWFFASRVFENRVLRRVLGPKRGELTGGWRKRGAS
jgi:hypothetical protein